MVCKALRDHGVTKDIDVHLMVQPVDAMIQDFAKAGASYITFHPEASNHVDRLVSSCFFIVRFFILCCTTPCLEFFNGLVIIIMTKLYFLLLFVCLY